MKRILRFRRSSRQTQRLLAVALAASMSGSAFASDGAARLDHANDAPLSPVARASPEGLSPRSRFPIAESIPLQPGEYRWTPELTTSGQLVVLVSLPQQLAHVYRNNVRIGVSTISSGKPGHETPTGVFEILEKNEEHYSNLYDDAPMPYMQRLTWDGIALHAGRIPGHPASHGCVRLPEAFARALFAETERGMLVVVADDRSHGPAVTRPQDRAPIDAYSGRAIADLQQQVAFDAGNRSAGAALE